MNKTVKINLFAFFMVFCNIFAQANDVTLQYIEQYKSIAINEMNRLGIPASIKMAQAILESNSGRSTLARQSNNHFGIKCGGNWAGKEVYREDDDYHNGLLIRSCFRAYDDPAESFIAHSEFLANPKSSRYKFLFLLDKSDYRGWAYGLQKAGYATDPKYPDKLISLIEKYQLYLLDQIPMQEAPLMVMTTVAEDNSPPVTTDAKPSAPIVLNAIHATSTARLLNEDGLYTVQKGDQIASIAALFNMSPQELYIRNRLPSGSQPLIGQKLYVSTYMHFSSRPAHTSTHESQSEEYLWEETITIESD